MSTEVIRTPLTSPEGAVLHLPRRGDSGPRTRAASGSRHVNGVADAPDFPKRLTAAPQTNISSTYQP